MKLFVKKLLFNKGNYEVPKADEIIFNDNQSLQFKYDLGIIGNSDTNNIVSNFITRAEHERIIEELNDTLNKVINYFEAKADVIMRESNRVDVNILATLSNSNKPVTGITLDKDSFILSIGETQSITYKATPNNANNKGVVWLSSEATIFIIATDGKNNSFVINEEEAMIIPEEDNIIDINNLRSRKKNDYEFFLEEGLTNKVYATAKITVV